MLPSLNKVDWLIDYLSVLDRFIDEFLFLPTPELGDEDDQCTSHGDDDFVKKYSLCLLKYFFIFLDLKDAVKEGNGARLATQKFNSYAIEMLISIVQSEVFLLEAEAYQCILASTANWRGGPGKNVEIDILQENRNCDIKKEIKVMGANKTDKAI